MSLTSLIIVIIIIANVIWLGQYDSSQIIKIIGNPKATFEDIDAYVRMRAIFTIIGNALVLGTFAGLVVWGTSKKAFGLFFGAFWGLIFLANGIGTPFYFIKVNALIIISSVLNLFITIIMFAYVVELMQIRARIRQEMARRK